MRLTVVVICNRLALMQKRDGISLQQLYSRSSQTDWHLLLDQMSVETESSSWHGEPMQQRCVLVSIR